MHKQHRGKRKKKRRAILHLVQSGTVLHQKSRRPHVVYCSPFCFHWGSFLQPQALKKLVKPAALEQNLHSQLGRALHIPASLTAQIPYSNNTVVRSSAPDRQPLHMWPLQTSRADRAAPALLSANSGPCGSSLTTTLLSPLPRQLSRVLLKLPKPQREC